MYDYFDLFKTVEVNGLKLVDISTTIKVTNDMSKYLSSYYINESETVNDIAYKLYDDDRLYWLIYLVNPGLVFNEPRSAQSLLEYVEATYGVSCLKLSSSFKLFPDEPSIELVATDISTGEIVPITEIDYTRKQVILSRWVDNPSLYYKLVDSYVPVSSKASKNVYVTEGYFESGYVEPVSDIIPDQEFDNIKYGDSVRHYVYNGAVYFQNPAFAPIDRVSSYTFYQYEDAVNDNKRFINVISPEHKNDAMEVVRKYLEDSGL
jgi:hypothetical protein